MASILGDVQCRHIREQILSRVFRLLLCSVEDSKEIVNRVDWGHGDELPVSWHVFPDSWRLRAEQATFPESRFDEDGNVETMCTFFTERGELMRFVWVRDWWDDSTTVVVDARVLDVDGKTYELDEPRLKPWTTRDLRYMVDADSQEIDELVRANPWWERLEFQIKREQSMLSGFRDYLGNGVFNEINLFKTFAVVTPATIILLFAMLYVWYYDMNEPAVFRDWQRMGPHLALVLGVGITTNIVGIWMQTAWAARCFVNFCMYALEKQVNRDWAIVMQMEVEQEPDKMWAQPHFIKEITEQSVLWQIVSCESSMDQIASMLLALLVDHDLPNSMEEV